MVNVVTIAAYRRIYWLRLIGLVQRSAATWRCVLHSSDEPGELLQWQCTATMTAPSINITIRPVDLEVEFHVVDFSHINL